MTIQPDDGVKVARRPRTVKGPPSTGDSPDLCWNRARTNPIP
jgi:hypothetical protein